MTVTDRIDNYLLEGSIKINWDTSNSKDGTLKYLTPDEYFNYLDILSISRRQTSKIAVKKYKDKMIKGDKIKSPELWIENDETFKQEGRHRLMAAESLGVKKIPVVIYKYI